MKQPSTIDWTIAKNIRRVRKDKQISLIDVARQIGISYQQLRKYETCANRISAGKLWELSIVYEMPIQNFFKNSD